ncbi:MAG: two component transcriptional regulator, LytTR family [Chthonomonadaceae bacterium]|nr:two component transcriptional regulator, LytTR family [Chthonomonadaceae bacterium]
MERKPLNILIADDEPLARSRLRRLLKQHEALIVGEAENAAQTLRLAEDLRPDLVLLDIQMPGLTGMQIAETLLHLEPAPLLIFVTGFSEYAVAAFETDAVDYLLKPVTSERLTVSLERAHTRLTDRQARLESQRLVREAAEAAPPLRSLPARGDYAVRFLPLNEILCAVAREKRVFILTREGEFRAYHTLTRMESLLPPEDFVRIHDSALVHLKSVVELLSLGDHAYEVRLNNGQRLRVGRTRYAELQRRLGPSHPKSA